jgi:hypothetical protein
MATQDPTTNYSWALPDVGGDTGAWGTMLNAIIGDDATGIDAVVKAVSDVANAALAKAGGTMTGPVKFIGTVETVVAQGNMTGTSTLDLDGGDFFHGTLTGVCTIDFTNFPSSGDVEFWFLEITNGGAYAITWGVDEWVGGVAPTLQSSGVDLLMFWTRDGGTTVRGGLAMENLS